jgi:uncharacterized RDD family membrane protein YckC
VARITGPAEAVFDEASLGSGTAVPLTMMGKHGIVKQVPVLIWFGILMFLALALVAHGISMIGERRALSRAVLRHLREPDAKPLAELPAAALWRRAVALIVDSFVMMPFAMLLLDAFGVTIEGDTIVMDARLVGANVVFYLLFVMYFIVCEWRFGQTIGKRLCRIRVVAAHGGHVTLTGAVIRNIVRLVDGVSIVALIGLAVAMSTRRSQRLGDLIARTVVVSDTLPEDIWPQGQRSPEKDK